MSEFAIKMMKMTMKLLFSILAMAAVCSAQTAVYGHNDKYLLPDRNVTPGAVNPAIVADRSGKSILVDGVEANICAKGFTTDPYKKTTEAMKHQVCERYGEKDCLNPSKGEIDHLVPLEIGGKDTTNNLWWLPQPDARVKDQLDAKLKHMVCSGKFSLHQAQFLMRANWVVGMWNVETMEKCNNCSMKIAPELKVPKRK